MIVTWTAVAFLVFCATACFCPFIVRLPTVPHVWMQVLVCAHTNIQIHMQLHTPSCTHTHTHTHTHKHTWEMCVHTRTWSCMNVALSHAHKHATKTLISVLVFWKLDYHDSLVTAATENLSQTLHWMLLLLGFLFSAEGNITSHLFSIPSLAFSVL